MNGSQPGDFIYRPDMSVDDIPAERVGLGDLGLNKAPRPTEYTRVPVASYPLFPPSSRLILCLLFAPTVFGEDAPGGWTKLGRGLTERFGLRDRYVHRRAVQALERGGVVEVRRRQGATTLLRLKDRQD